MASMCVLSSVSHHLKLHHISINWNVGFNLRYWQNQATKIVDLEIREPKSRNWLKEGTTIATKP